MYNMNQLIPKIFNALDNFNIYRMFMMIITDLLFKIDDSRLVCDELVIVSLIHDSNRFHIDRPSLQK